MSRHVIKNVTFGHIQSHISRKAAMMHVYEQKLYRGMDDWYDTCYECCGYGDDYYIDDDGELQQACDDCPCNPMRDDE